MSAENASEVLLQTVEDGICTLTLNRPSVMNALNGALVERLRGTFAALDARRDVRVVILTGAGERAFCVGADLKERSGMTDGEVQQRLRDYRAAFRVIESVNKPVICAINGYALGGGLELALACDLRIVADEAQVGLTELRLGIIPGAGGTQRLARLVGSAKAKELIFGAERISATEAVRLGIANRSAPRDALLEHAHSWAEQLARSAPIALAQAKVAISAGIQTDLETGLAIEAQAYAVTIPTKDRREGLAAFVEKRDPVWHGE